MFTLPTNYDADLMQLAHYQNFPQMLPFIGEHYIETKLLLIGESHYLPHGSTVQNDVKKWYNSSIQNLTDKKGVSEQSWTNTREAVDDFLKNGLSSSKAYTVWANPENAIQEYALNNNRNFNFQGKKGFEHLAFYNFFQRPAEVKGGSINVTELDVRKATETLEHIIKIIEPEFIMFISSMAWDNISQDFRDKYPNIKFDSCPHPGCRWWNRKANKYGENSIKRTGREKFIKFLQDNKIF